MLHLTKLAVGVRDIGQLQAMQRERAAAAPPLRHRTRNAPRRAGEVIDGGSIYWVIGGSMLARQRIVDIAEDRWDDGGRCAALMLDATIVPLEGRPMKPFQGWRYLAPQDAPADLRPGYQIPDDAALPAALERALRALCLL